MISFKKVGAIRFVKLGRFGFSFWVAKKSNATRAVRSAPKSRNMPLDCWAILRQGV